jgi:arylsulfatase A-like enzyme
MRPATAYEMRAHYYAATTFMDSMVGLLLEGLAKEGQEQTTAVLFHSDHGRH